MTMARQQIWDETHGAVPIIRVPANWDITSDQVQPASIDLRLGRKVAGVKIARLPGPHEHVSALMQEPNAEFTFELGTGKTNVLKKGQTYLIELIESCALPKNKQMLFSGKSSSGRNGLFTRVVCNNNESFDKTTWGYQGPLCLEVTPLAFDVQVKMGLPLVQGRIRTKKAVAIATDDELRDLHTQEGLVYRDGKALVGDLDVEEGELYYHVDLDRPVVALVAKENVDLPLDLTAKDAHDPADYWVPVLGKKLRNKRLPLFPGLFYLLATREQTYIPADVCAQMQATKVGVGEIRTHYAGFFDPGFNNVAVLEVQARDMPFAISDGSRICSMTFERMLVRPDQLYGAQSGSHYAGKTDKVGPSLSKSFLNREEAWTLPYWRGVYAD